MLHDPREHGRAIWVGFSGPAQLIDDSRKRASLTKGLPNWSIKTPARSATRAAPDGI